MLDKQSGDKKDKPDEDESYRLRVREKQALNVSAFHIRLVGNVKQPIVPIKNKVNILVAERDHRSVVNYQVVEKRIGLLVGIVDCFLVKLKFGHAQSAQYHERTRCRDNKP